MIFLFLMVLISTWLALHVSWLIVVILCLVFATAIYIKRLRMVVIISLVVLISAFMQSQYQQAVIANPILNSYQGWAYVEIQKPDVIAASYKKYTGRVLIIGKTKVDVPITLYQYSPEQIRIWPKKYWLNIKIQKINHERVYALIKTVAFPGYAKQNIWQLKSKIAQWIWQTNGDSKESAILMAIALGDRAYLTNDIWLVFARTGTSHLLAIAGLHLGVIIFIIWCVVSWLWRRSEKGMHLISAQVASLSIAVISAIGYGFFTGWAIPCQRASIMIAVLCFSQMGWFNLTMIDRVFLAFAVILAVNPSDIYSQSYWLSFIAVVSICYGMQMQPNMDSWLKQWLYLNLIITFSLLPWSLYLFGQYAFIGWLANLIAVPWVAFFLLPLVFLAVLLQSLAPILNIHLWQWCGWLLTPLWQLLENMSYWHLAYIQMAPPILFCVLFALGYFWLFAPKAVPGKYWVCLLMLPLFLSMVTVIPYGASDIKSIKIGKQQASIVRTRHHVELIAKDPTKLHLTQWDYKTIAANVGSYSLMQHLDIRGRQIHSLLIDGALISKKTLSPKLKNSI